MTAPLLARSAFKTSRLLDFCSLPELVKQIGHGVEAWPLVIVKELVDNAIDACEESDTPPVISIQVADGAIIVADNGRGIPPETVKNILDFATRTSSREAYVSPTRGAQGNALKTILAMGYALDGTVGETVIESQGAAHRITFRADPVRQEPRIEHAEEPSEVKIGTRVTVFWPVCACSQLDDAKWEFLLFAESFSWLNPHLGLTVTWDGELLVDFAASNPAWAKWRPSDPTSPHWYDEARLKRLMGAYIADDEDHGREPRFVRDFVGEFRGLSGSAKKATVLEAAGAARMTLPEFFANGDVAALLEAMQDNSRAVQSKDIGEIGRESLAGCFAANGVDPATFEYRRIFGEPDGLPYVVEVAFGYRPEGEERVMVSGLNWSPAIINPFRQLGHFESLDSILSGQRCGHDEPLVFALHLACPRVSFTDHGKGAVAVDWRTANHIKEAVLAVTKKWAKQRKAEERDAAAQANRIARLHGSSERYTVKAAAAEIMQQAYMAASANGSLPASARQIMYQARDHIQEATGKQLNDQYFCQTLLPDYINEHGLNWDVVFDDRGHFVEPHTERSIGLGTIAVREYLAERREPWLNEARLSPASIITHGPEGCFSAVLFVEKEGFTPLFEAVQLRERYDIAIMSTKGMSVVAARTLIDRLGVPAFVLHDFDKAGFSIAGTLQRDTRRYEFGGESKIIDIGLRLDDVMALGLEGKAESVFDRGDDDAKRENLRLNGATDEEVEFLLHRRVELNALTSDQLVAFIESKFDVHRIKKLVPPQALLDDAYQLFVRSRRIEKIVKEALANDSADREAEAPEDIVEQVRDYLAKNPHARWDEAVAALADEE